MRERKVWPSYFPRTRWSLVAAARAEGESRPAFGELCAMYVASVQRFVRGSGRALREAQDVTQSVFARLLRPGALAQANPEGKPFRHVLIGVIKSVISNDWKRARAKKRGGGAIVLSLDACAADGRHDLEPVDTETPDRAYRRRQRAELCRRVRLELERWYAARAKREQFQRLLPYLDGREPPYAALASELGVPAGTLRGQVLKMRNRFGALVWADFRRRGIKPDDIEREIRNLLDESP